MFILVVYLYILGSFCNHSELQYISSQTATPTCSSSKEFVAPSTRPHHAHCRPHQASNSNPLSASFCGSPTPCSPTQTHCPGTSNDGGIMEVQALLESSQWKASALSTLWRPLEQDAGSELHAAQERDPSRRPKSRGRSPHVKNELVHWMALGWIHNLSRSGTQWLSKTCRTRPEDDEGRKTRTRASLMRL